MPLEAATSPSSSGRAPASWGVRAGRILTAVNVFMLFASAISKIAHRPEMIDEIVIKLGYSEAALVGLGILEIACTLLYAFPRTAVLGAVLLTGYLGGAVASHVRIGDLFVIPAALGVLVWLALFLRDARVRALLPLRFGSGMPRASS